TNTFGNQFIHDFGLNPLYQDSFIVQYPSILLSISQMAEVCFILAIPFVLKRYGIKTVMLLSMFAWTLRFGFFAFGDPTAIGLMFLIMSMIVYGCAFDFFNISGSIFIEKEVDTRMRASAQGLFMTMVNGVGAYFGAILSGQVVDYFTFDGIKDWQMIWLVFASYTVILAIIFQFTFHYHHDKNAALKKVKAS
ncbi:MAG: MFS transporter, partial [Providencia sp.]|uniref:MFS transporter n=1 Tax=Providencia sp. TaxID=589 RepID=UPI003F94F136